MEVPLVSICMITYNQEKFVEQAIKSALNQATKYKIELIISNDASTDGTDEVIRKCLRNNPSNIEIRYFNHDKNLGMIPNFIFSLKKCRGKYIAFLEGDDFWNDPNKLQFQVEFLEKNLDFSICYHPVKIFDHRNKKFVEDTITRDMPEVTSINDLAWGNYMHTPSVVLRNDFVLKKWFKKAKMGDWTLYMDQIKKRKIKKINNEMAVYRLHGNSVWSSQSKKENKRKTSNNVLLLFLNGEFSTTVMKILEHRILNSGVKFSLLDRIKFDLKRKFI